MNDTKCAETWVNFNAACVSLWDVNSSMPTCTDECKKRMDEVDQNSISTHIKCCECGNNESATETMVCNLIKRNIDELCNFKVSVSEYCQRNKRACELIKSTEVVIDSEGKCTSKT